MKLRSSQQDKASLTAFGEEARALLIQQNYSELANRFGYVLPYDRAPAQVIEADFLSAAASPYKIHLLNGASEPAYPCSQMRLAIRPVAPSRRYEKNRLESS